MKKIVSIIFSIVMLSSCNSQSKIDLLELSFPLDKEILINNEFITNLEKPQPEAKYYGATSIDSNLMYASGKNIGGNKDNPTNFIMFLSSKTHKIIGYRLKIKTTNETEMLDEILTSKFGHTDYYRSDEFSTIRVWENKESKVLYLFGHYYPSNNNSPHACDLYAFNLSELDTMLDLGPSRIQYYLTYLKRRNQKQDINYSYRDFAEEENEEGFGHEHYLEAIENLYKH